MERKAIKRNENMLDVGHVRILMCTQIHSMPYISFSIHTCTCHNNDAFSNVKDFLVIHALRG